MLRCNFFAKWNNKGSKVNWLFTGSDYFPISAFIKGLSCETSCHRFDVFFQIDWCFNFYSENAVLRHFSDGISQVQSCWFWTVTVRQRPGVNYLICNLCLIDFYWQGYFNYLLCSCFIWLTKQLIRKHPGIIYIFLAVSLTRVNWSELLLVLYVFTQQKFCYYFCIMVAGFFSCSYTPWITIWWHSYWVFLQKQIGGDPDRSLKKRMIQQYLSKRKRQAKWWCCLTSPSFHHANELISGSPESTSSFFWCLCHCGN